MRIVSARVCSFALLRINSATVKLQGGGVSRPFFGEAGMVFCCHIYKAAKRAKPKNGVKFSSLGKILRSANSRHLAKKAKATPDDTASWTRPAKIHSYIDF